MFSIGNTYNSVPASLEVEDDIELAEAEVLNPINQNEDNNEDERENVIRENGAEEDEDNHEESNSSNHKNNKILKNPHNKKCFNEIKVLDMKGKMIKFNNNIPLSSTIGDLKIFIEDEINLPIMLQRLIYSGKQLNDDEITLIDAKIKDNTVIHLFQRPQPKQTTTSTSSSPIAVATAVRNTQNTQMDAVVATPSVNSNRNNIEMVEEFETYRRRVKLLACMLFLVSMLNLVTIILIILDATTQSLKTEEWISLFVELFVNAIGVIVAVNGIQGTNTLDQNKVQQYCIGLVVVGCLYIGIDLYRLTRSIMMNNHSNGGGGSNDKVNEDDELNNGDNNNDDGNNNDPIGAAAISLFFTLSIWSICFYRAFQFRYHLNLALEHDTTAVTAELAV